MSYQGGASLETLTAQKASELATARTINEVPFDGTANITVGAYIRQFTQTGAGNVAVSTNYDVYLINKTVGQATTVTLPAITPARTQYTIIDAKGDCSTNNITVTGAELILGGGNTTNSFVMKDDYSVLILQSNGTTWNVTSYSGNFVDCFFGYPNGLTIDGNYLSSSVSSNGNQNFSFSIPSNFRSLLSANLVGYASSAGAVGTNKNITLTSNFCLSGQSRTFNSQSSPSIITVPSLNQIFKINAGAVLSGIVPNQYGGLKITHNGIGGTISYLYLEIIYIRR